MQTPTTLRDAAASYARFAWGVVGYNLFVIVWGAFVRATGSGAGCGSHWPLCNGEVVPQAPAVATLIEFGHRLTSGVALLLVVALVVGAWRRFPAGHAVRRAAGWSGFLMLTEALIGAGLVLLEYVADDMRVARGWWVGGHLINTFLLVAALTLVPWFAAGHAAPRWRDSGGRGVLLGAALAGVLLLGVSGAITALGDTLFPAASFAEGKAQTFSDSAHLFVRLRIWHPTLALAVGGLLALVVHAALRPPIDATARRLGLGLGGLYALQLGLGVINVFLLAPVPVQLLHLLVSDLIWMSLVLLSATLLAARPGAATVRPASPAA